MKRLVVVLLSIILILTLAVPAIAELRKGSKGADVVELQKRLIELGYLDGDADGAFGKMTESAVKAFQENNGLDATGIATIKDTSIMFADSAITSQGAPFKSDEQSENGNSSEEDTRNNLSNPSEKVPTSSLETVTLLPSDCEMEIVEAGWTMSYGYLFYAIKLHNNSNSIAYEYPSYRITARDANNALLGTEDQTLNVLYPNQYCVWAGLGFELSETPAKVEFEIITPDDWNVTTPSALTHSEYIPLTVEGVSKKGSRILGEVKNTNDYSVDSAAVVVIFRDNTGAMFAGDVTFVDAIKAGGSVPFDMDYLSDDIVTDNYEVYACPW